jgi:hypothetical protein
MEFDLEYLTYDRAFHGLNPYSQSIHRKFALNSGSIALHVTRLPLPCLFSNISAEGDR